MTRKGEFKWFFAALILATSALITWQFFEILSWALLLGFFGLVALYISVFRAIHWRRKPAYILISAGIIAFLSGLRYRWISKLMDHALANLTWEDSEKWCFDLLVMLRDSLLTTNKWLVGGGFLLVLLGVYLEAWAYIQEKKLHSSFLKSISKKVDKALIEEGTIVDSDLDVEVTIKVRKIHPSNSSEDMNREK